jgi:hypothetical protein
MITRESNSYPKHPTLSRKVTVQPLRDANKLSIKRALRKFNAKESSSLSRVCLFVLVCERYNYVGEETK